MILAQPASPAEVLAALEQAEHELAALLGGLLTHTFFAGDDERWSPGHHARHLTLSNRPLTTALRLPKLAVAAVGGKTKRDSRDYAGIQALYQAALASGGRASGRFLPTLPAASPEAQAGIITEFRGSVQDLRDSLGGWSAADQGRYLLPHPLLGKLTVNEMLSFAVIHHRHHLQGIGGLLARV